MVSLETLVLDVFCFYKFFGYTVILKALELPGESSGRPDLYKDIIKVVLFWNNEHVFILNFFDYFWKKR